MKNADRPAFPTRDTKIDGKFNFGLSRREYFAAMAMQGILTHTELLAYKDYDITLSERCEDIAALAKLQADTLIKELEK